GEAIENLLAPGIAEVLQANVKRINTDLGGDFVEESLVRERVLQSPWRPDPRGSKRGRLQSMGSGCYVWKEVRDRQVVKHTAGAEFAEAVEFGKIGPDQGHETGGAVRYEQLRLPGGHIAFRINPSPHIKERRRSLRVPAILVRAHPLYAYRLAHRAGEQRSVRSGILVSIAAVTASAFEIYAADVGVTNGQHSGELPVPILP